MRPSAVRFPLWARPSAARPLFRSFLTGLLLCCGALLYPWAARAQDAAATVHVVVTDSLGEPLEGARVALGGIGFTALTDSAGEVRLLNVPSGRMDIVIELFGYRSDSSTVDLVPGHVHRVRFDLYAQAIPVEGVLVEVIDSKAQLDLLRGFEERRERGIGYFMTREDIERSGTHDLSNLLHMVPGLRTSPSQFGQSRMRAVRTPVTRQCQIKVYIDGMQYRSPDDLPGIPTSDIEAIEIYRGRSELPAQFADLDSNCGAIVIWSRRHR